MLQSISRKQLQHRPRYSDPNTYHFNLYFNPDCSDATPINGTTPIAITIAGSGTATKSQSVTLTALQLAAGAGTVPIYAKEVEAINSAPAGWTYDKDTESCSLSRSKVSDTVSFENTYAPKGTLTVQKAWVGEAGTSVNFTVQKPKTVDANNEVTEWEPAGGGTISGPTWQTQITGLDLNTQYRVVETGITGAIAEDYIPSYTPGQLVTFGLAYQ